MFLNITPGVSNWSSDSKEFSLIFDENPLAEFVELPSSHIQKSSPDPNAVSLWYSNVLCGVLRGALEMVRARAWD